MLEVHNMIKINNTLYKRTLYWSGNLYRLGGICPCKSILVLQGSLPTDLICVAIYMCRVCKVIIDGCSFTNAISSDIVRALSLSTRRLPTPCYMQWMNQSGTLKIIHKARVKFFIGNDVENYS